MKGRGGRECERIESPVDPDRDLPAPLHVTSLVHLGALKLQRLGGQGSNATGDSDDDDGGGPDEDEAEVVLFLSLLILFLWLMLLGRLDLAAITNTPNPIPFCDILLGEQIGVQPDRANARGNRAARCSASHEEESKVPSPRDGVRNRRVSVAALQVPRLAILSSIVFVS